MKIHLQMTGDMKVVETITNNMDNRIMKKRLQKFQHHLSESGNINNESTKADGSGNVASRGQAIGVIALIISILSLFMMPFILGILGIIVGIVARSRGSNLGTWAIVIGAISIIVGIFILPFF